MTKFYVDASGNYLGGFDGAQPPIGSTEVPFPPQDGRMIWNNGSWSFTTAILDQIDNDEAGRALNVKALRAMADVTFQFVKNPALFTTAADYKQAIRNRFKVLNGG